MQALVVRWLRSTAYCIAGETEHRVPGDEDVFLFREAKGLALAGYVEIVGRVSTVAPARAIPGGSAFYHNGRRLETWRTS